MKTVIALLFLLASACSLNAQITVTLKRFAAHSPEIEIRNNSTVSLTAFAVTMAPVARDGANSTPFMAYVDMAVDTDRLISYQLKTTMPLLPNQEYTVPLPTRLRPGQPREDLFQLPIVAAGVFADGTTAGDAALLARLILRRSNMLQAVELAREILSDAGRRNMPRGLLIDQFVKLADSLNHWYLPAEQQVGRVLYQSIAGKLVNLPQLEIGSPFPPTTFVAQETAMLNRPARRVVGIATQHSGCSRRPKVKSHQRTFRRYRRETVAAALHDNL